MTAQVLYLEDFTKQARSDIETRIREMIIDRSDREVIVRAIEGGKRLRPILLLLVFNSLGGKDSQKAMDVACALELAHNASLIHDDVIDNDTVRRGKTSLWRELGIGKAVIQGHRIINLAFQTVLAKGLELGQIFLNAWDRASSGLFEEVLSRELPTKTLYLRIIREKTASLFGAAAECGAVISGATHTVRVAAREFGEFVGIAYQLADDYMEVRKGRGLFRIPLVALQLLEDRIRNLFLSLVRKKDVRSAWRMISLRVDMTSFYKEEISRYIEKAEALIDLLPVTEEHWRDALRLMPRFSVNSLLSELKESI